MIPILSVVGKSDSGKTNSLEKLIPELTRRGWRVAMVVLYIPPRLRGGLTLARTATGTSTGAHTAVIASPWRLAAIRDVERDLTLDEIRDRFIQDVDLVPSGRDIRTTASPRSRCSGLEQHRREPICKRSDGLVALVSDTDIDLGVPAWARRRRRAGRVHRDALPGAAAPRPRQRAGGRASGAHEIARPRLHRRRRPRDAGHPEGLRLERDHRRACGAGEGRRDRR